MILVWLKFASMVVIALVLQVSIFPAYLREPFIPNLLLIITVWLGLRGPLPLGGALAFLLGLLQDSFSGLYLGLHGFTYLLTYLVLRRLADNLYTESGYLMTLVVLLATLANGFLHLLLLLLFSSAQGMFGSLFPALLPQGLVTALAASLIAAASFRSGGEEQS
jgi:rod shape-determining protein MreD